MKAVFVGISQIEKSILNTIDKEEETYYNQHYNLSEKGQVVIKYYTSS